MTVLYLFDIDGTLLHAHGSGRGVFDAIMAELHGIADASDGIRYGGKTDAAIIDEIFIARLGRVATVAERSAFLDAYIPRLRTMLIEQGVHIGEFHNLEALARDGVYEFCYMCTTNKIRGTAAGFCLRPIAIK